MAHCRSAAQRMMDDLLDRDVEPQEWASRKNSTDIFFYHTKDSRERQLNLESYFISFPWVLRIREQRLPRLPFAGYAIGMPPQATAPPTTTTGGPRT